MKIDGGPFDEKKILEKRPTMSKKLEGGPYSLARHFMLREKREKHFWFSSLRQMFKYDTIKFRRTFKNYFGQFVWIEKSH